MRLIFLLSLFSLTAFAQTPAPATPAATSPAPLSTWLGVGSGYLNPGIIGFGMFVTPVSQSAGLHSWTAEVFTPVKGHTPTMQTNSGLYLDLRTFTFGDVSVTLGALGAPGVSTSSTATTFSLAAGGGVMITNENKWPRLGLWIGGLRNQNATSTRPELLMAWMYRVGVK